MNNVKLEFINSINFGLSEIYRFMTFIVNTFPKRFDFKEYLSVNRDLKIINAIVGNK